MQLAEEESPTGQKPKSQIMVDSNIRNPQASLEYFEATQGLQKGTQS